MKRIRLIFWLLLALGAMAGQRALAAPPTQARTDAFQAVPCETFEITSSAFECGYVTVPEFHAEPNGRQIQLATAILPARGDSPTRDALVMQQGGPGGSTLDLFTQFVSLGYFPALDDLREERDIVLYDQRGALYSKPALMCPEELDLTFRTIEQQLSPDQELELQAEAALACRERLVREGINLAAYNSIENALDIEDVRRALGYDKFDFYGISYGTLLGLHALRETPDTFRSMTLDAVVPAQVNPNVTIAESQQRAFDELFARCAADAACSRAYPNLKQVLYQVVDALNAKPARVPVTDDKTGKTYNAVMDGDTFLNVLFQFLYNSELLPALPKLIYDAQNGSYGLIQQFYPLYLFDRTFASGMYYSVMCAEDADFDVSDLLLEGVDEPIAVSQKRDTAYFLDLCKKWDVPQLGAAADAPITSDVPTLLFSGQFDPITPPPFAQVAAETITPSYPFIFPAYGHGALTSGNCPDEILDEFVRDPDDKPDAECIREVARVDFVTAADYVMLPGIGRVQAALLQGKIQFFILPLLLLLILLSVLWVAPIVWLVRLIRKRPGEPDWWARLVPWFAAGIGAAAAFFAIALFAVLIFATLNNAATVALMLGTPRPAALLYLLPLAVLALTILLVIAMVMVWRRKDWDIWRRVYYTVVALAAVGLTVWFAANDMLTALFRA